MFKPFHALFLMLAQSTHDELIRQNQYLKVENETLRSRLPKRITVTPAERSRLLKYGRLIGPAIKELISIVHPRTFARWLADEKKDPNKLPAKRGRPRTKVEIRELIFRMARENNWGYTRILGELAKLGIRKIGRTTLQNILKAAGFDPNPSRGRSTWDEFIARHAATLWACDFLSVKTWTHKGLTDLYILFFIHVDSRQVFVSNATAHPDAQWTEQQARNFCIHLDEQGLEAAHLLRDRDSKFTEKFDAILKAQGAKVQPLPVRSPNLNAYSERFVQTLKVECLRHFVILGRKHLDYLVREFVDYYHRLRPHQGKDNELLLTSSSPQPTEGKVVCEERLGGLLKHYYRQAA